MYREYLRLRVPLCNSQLNSEFTVTNNYAPNKSISHNSFPNNKWNYGRKYGKLIYCTNFLWLGSLDWWNNVDSVTMFSFIFFYCIFVTIARPHSSYFPCGSVGLEGETNVQFGCIRLSHVLQIKHTKAQYLIILDMCMYWCFPRCSF